MNKPDFEKLALEMTDECKEDNHAFDCVCSAREEGMSRIWNDYVEPAELKIKELEEKIIELEINQLEKK